MEDQLIKEIKKAMVDCDTNATNIAELLGFSRAYMSNVMNGKKTLTVPLFIAICGHLGVSGSEVMRRAEKAE